MKAIGRNIIIKKKKEDTVKKTDGGLMLTHKQQTIFYGKNASNRLEVNKEVFYVIRDIDVVVVL